MSEQNAVPLLVVSAAQDPVEAINIILRRAGQAVHCTWVASAREVAESIPRLEPQLLIHVGLEWDTLQTYVNLRDRLSPSLPLIVVSDETLDEAQIAELMDLGAHDAVSFAYPERLRAVMIRELRAYRTLRAQEHAQKSASDARTQLETLLAGSNDAIAQVQEGILVDANRTWLALLGADSSVVGEPVMDLFEEASQPALRAALSAAGQGRWDERTLKVSARGPRGAVPLELVLVQGEHDGEPCVRLVVPGEAARNATAQPPPPVRPVAPAPAPRAPRPPPTAQPGAGQRPAPPVPTPAPARAAAAAAPSRAALPAAGDDRAWVRQIRTALVENRFRLVPAPIASLQGEDTNMFDVLLRMLDPDGREILPEQFMGAAERHELTRNIDRWVIGASLSFAQQRQPGCLFVRLSRDTVQDATFLPWLDNHLRSRPSQPERLCFQVSEEVAAGHLQGVRALSEAVRERSFRFAVESFGTREDSHELLEHLPVDFVKLDASLMQGIVSDAPLLEHVRMLIDAASQQFIQTIGEGVHDSDTMSVLWQAGMQYVQGSFGEPQPQPRERARQRS